MPSSLSIACTLPADGPLGSNSEASQESTIDLASSGPITLNREVSISGRGATPVSQGFGLISIGYNDFAGGISMDDQTHYVQVGCFADYYPDGVLNFFDVSAFLGYYNAQDPVADLYPDAQFNFFDVSAFLSDYNAGCQ